MISGFFGIAGLAGWMAAFSGATRPFESGAAWFFLSYGAIVLGLAARPSVRHAGIGVVAANLLYTAVAVILILTNVLRLNVTGVAFTVESAVYTLTFAAQQYLGWRRVDA